MLTQDFKPSIPAEFNLLSTDVKPTDCPNGSRINEIDTGKVYLFDEENKMWYEKPNSGGGGGGGGSVTVDTTVNGASANPVQNKAIYDFVNSSVATNTANFIGTFNSVAELNGYSGTITNNDYAFVISTDTAGNTVYNRYKYNGSAWVFEYALNNSSFTAAQWATIQSGLTASDKTKLDGIDDGANKTVVDANLSQTSTNPVQNKVVNAALNEKVDTLNFTADRERQETEIGTVANAGAKNLFNINATPIAYHTTSTLTDEKLTVSASGAWAHYSVPIDLPAGDYILSMTISDYSKASEAPDTSMRIRMSAMTSGGTSVVLQTVNGNGAMAVPFTWDGGTLYVQFYPNYNATSYANSFAAEYVMIRRASITDDTFVPYAKTNRELTVAGDDDRAALVALVDGGAKNLINITDPVSVPSGINVTKDGNHIVVSGTVTSNLALIVLASNLQPVTCSLVLSGCPTGGSINSYRLDIRQDSAVVQNAIDYGDGSPEFTVSHGSAFEVVIRLARGTYENLDFTPMLCTAADYAISPAFVPYRPSWQEMYDMIKALQNGA